MKLPWVYNTDREYCLIGILCVKWKRSERRFLQTQYSPQDPATPPSCTTQYKSRPTAHCSAPPPAGQSAATQEFFLTKNSVTWTITKISKNHRYFPSSLSWKDNKKRNIWKYNHWELCSQESTGSWVTQCGKLSNRSNLALEKILERHPPPGNGQQHANFITALEDLAGAEKCK